jgi:hypothetical protein
LPARGPDLVREVVHSGLAILGREPARGWTGPTSENVAAFPVLLESAAVWERADQRKR